MFEVSFTLAGGLPGTPNGMSVLTGSALGKYSPQRPVSGRTAVE
jgi:hypothetical protein